MASDIRRVLTDRKIRARPLSLRKRAWRRLKRHRRATAASALGVLVLAIIGTAITKRILAAINQQVPVVTDNTAVLAINWQTHEERQGLIADDQFIEYPLEKTMKLLRLRPTSGDLQLDVNLALPAIGDQAQILFSDPGLADGYNLTVIKTHTSNDDAGNATETWALQLWRGAGEARTLVASTSMALPALDTAHQLVLLRNNDYVEVTIAGNEALTWRDLVPIEGSLNDKLHLALSSAASAGDLPVRVPTSAYVSALVPADVQRENGYLEAAMLEYQRFLTNFANDPDKIEDVFAARFRIGLCLRGLALRAAASNGAEEPDWQGVLDHFLAIEAAAVDQPAGERYIGPALFYAWEAALHVDFVQADAYLTRVREEFELSTVIADVPAPARKRLARRYMLQSRDYLDSDPDRTRALLNTALELSSYANNARLTMHIERDFADLIRFEGDYATALKVYEKHAQDEALQRSDRLSAQLRAAETLRLQGDFSTASHRYQGCYSTSEKAQTNRV